MALTLNGSANTIGGLAVGGLPDGSVATADLADGAVTSTKSTGLSGLSHASVWRVNTNFSLDSSDTTITANWEADDSYLKGTLGSAFDAPSSGIWTFPATGIWKVEMYLTWWVGTSTAYQALTIDSTPDNGSNWNAEAHGYSHKSYNNSRDDYTTTSVRAILDITNTSQSKIRFNETTSSGATAYCNTNENATYAVFMKLGDT